MDGESLAHTYGFVLWFLPALFVAKLLMYLVAKLTKRTLLQLGSITVLFAVSFFVNIPFGIDNGMNCVLWVFIGYAYFQRYQECKWLMALPLLLPLILCFTGGHFPALDVAVKEYGNIGLNILFASGMVYLFIIILKRVHYSNSIGGIIQLWGSNTMLLFMVHPYTNNISHIVVEKVGFFLG